MDAQAVNQQALEELQEHVTNHVAGALGLLLSYLGDRLGLYRALADKGPMSSGDLAAETGREERYIREWLSANAAGNYISHDPATDRYYLTPEQELVFAAEGDPNCMQGFFQAVMSSYEDKHMAEEAMCTGAGIPWGDHSQCLFCGTERFFRPLYAANLIDAWIPALDGVAEKLKKGAKVADVGCGHGSSTILMAKAFPNSEFFGIDFHGPSIDHARERARDAGVENARFEVAQAKEFKDRDYDLVAIFDALHDMGDPVGAAAHVRKTLAKDGTFMLVEPMAGDSLEENCHPLGQIFYSFSTLVCTPASKAQEVGLALGAQAGEKRLTEVLTEAGFGHVRRATETPTNMVLEARG